MGADEARTLTFTTLVLASIGLIFTNRSWSRSALATLQSPNAALWWVTIGAVAVLAVVLFVPVLSGLFSFSRLRGIDVLLCVTLGFATFMIFEVFKPLRTPRL
jgi:Ca2+-transporting ATPase